jgi:hypothetical protein
MVCPIEDKQSKNVDYPVKETSAIYKAEKFSLIPTKTGSLSINQIYVGLRILDWEKYCTYNGMSHTRIVQHCFNNAHAVLRKSLFMKDISIKFTNGVSLYK